MTATQATFLCSSPSGTSITAGRRPAPRSDASTAGPYSPFTRSLVTSAHRPRKPSAASRGPTSSRTLAPTTIGYERAPRSSRISSLAVPAITRAPAARLAIAASLPCHERANALHHLVDVQAAGIDVVGRDRVRGRPLLEQRPDAREPFRPPGEAGEQRTHAVPGPRQDVLR